MYNYFNLIGRVIDINKVRETFTVACQRPFKNANNEYDVDKLPILAPGVLTEMLEDHPEVKTHFISIKGRIEMTDDGLVLIAERLMFPNIELKE